MPDGFEREASCRDLKEKLHRLKLSMRDDYERLQKTRSRWRRADAALRSRLLLAALTFLAIAATLYVVNPPLTQRARRHRYDIERQDAVKVLVAASIGALPVLLAPARMFGGGRTSSNI